MRATFDLSPEALAEIARQVAELVPHQTRFADDGWLRGAERIAAYLDCKPDRVYALSSARRIPVHRDGAALIARKSELDAWVRNGGGTRP
jgi:hypothetical protein